MLKTNKIVALAVLYIIKNNKETRKAERKKMMKEYSLWVNKKDKTENYFLCNNFIEKDYKKGDTVVYKYWTKRDLQEIKLHDDLEIAVEYNEEDVVWGGKLDYFHGGKVSHETFYFNKPKNHGTALQLKNGLYLLILNKDGDEYEHGEVFADKQALKVRIEELLEL